ncbi:hypothetical protein DPMN_181346 [Dreissena polymorpha]|uniref:MAM domain-containing protein n=2 Tax=Dreissena polymorpha TaxID=45954 RepID=A0A9D4DDC6_DREPO|nr:hypothetical protein DPMN_181346 [Dreissena polymorpha]
MAALTTGTQYFPYNQVFSVNLQYRTGHNPMSLTVNITGSSRGDWAHSFTDTDENWTSICLDAIVKGPIDVTFIGGVAGNGRSYLALDDVTISYGRSCIGSTTLETPNNVSCSFETEDSCGYTNYDGENDFGFSRKQSWTISNNTGTTVDRNGLGRSYMAAVALTSQIEKAKLYSPSFSSTKNQQRVTFWYNINGEGPQTLKVYFTVQWVQGIPSFRKTKDSLIPAWEKGCVDVTASSNLASVVFEATVASGIVAVDDVSLEDGACATLTS